MTELITLDIESIAAGGDGVARRDSLVVFVPRTAPGDRIVANIDRQKRFARGTVESIETESPLRVEPECAHYQNDDCGGCQLQHIALTAQQDAKRSIIRDSIRRIGKRTIELPAIRAGSSPWRYRERLSLALRRRADGSWYAGMHAWNDPSHVFELHDCKITQERVIALWREVMSAADGLPDVPELRATVRVVRDRGALIVEGGTAWPGADAFANRLASFDHVWWIPETGRRRSIGAPREPSGPHASFSQVNPEVGQAMTAFVEEQIVGHSPAHVLDTYAGVGDLAALLHGRGIRVTAVELDEDATAHSASRLKQPSRALSARVEDLIAKLLPADVVVLNPPRSGLDQRVTAALETAADKPRAVIYISCDPATLARDLARMPSWTIVRVTAFDMFPQTAHVETVVELAPADIA